MLSLGSDGKTTNLEFCLHFLSCDTNNCLLERVCDAFFLEVRFPCYHEMVTRTLLSHKAMPNVLDYGPFSPSQHEKYCHRGEKCFFFIFLVFMVLN